MKRILLLSLVFSAALVSAAPKPGDFLTNGPRDKKRIALSYDDGPGPETARVLDALDKLGVKATFFMLGELAGLRPATVADVVARGHEPASHTMKHIHYGHRMKAIAKEQALSDAAAADAARVELVADMKESRRLIEKAAGKPLKLLRMPHGVDRPWIKAAAKEAGFVLVNWTYGADWIKTPTAEMAAAYVKDLKPGAVYLFHDGGRARDKTIAVTEAVVKAAREQGYEIVTVGELIGLNP